MMQQYSANEICDMINKLTAAQKKDYAEITVINPQRGMLFRMLEQMCIQRQPMQEFVNAQVQDVSQKFGQLKQPQEQIVNICCKP